MKHIHTLPLCLNYQVAYIGYSGNKKWWIPPNSKKKKQLNVIDGIINDNKSYSRKGYICITSNMVNTCEAGSQVFYESLILASFEYHQLHLYFLSSFGSLRFPSQLYIYKWLLPKHLSAAVS